MVIYLAFVSLGLPDTLLGSAWPVMRPELGVSLDAQGQNWRKGYLLIACIQFFISILLFITLPVWRGRDYKGEPLWESAKKHSAETYKRQPLLFIPGVALALLCYALFFSIQYGTALWSPSYLVGFRDFAPESAARTATVFYICVMTGRFVCGFLSAKHPSK